jgi:hypothetical protein
MIKTCNYFSKGTPLLEEPASLSADKKNVKPIIPANQFRSARYQMNEYAELAR